MDNFGKFEFHEQWKNPETGRMKKHVYLMDGVQMTGVTTVLGVIAKPALIQWAADMAVGYIKERAPLFKDVLTKIETKPAMQFTGMQNVPDDQRVVNDEILAEARVAHAKKKEAGGDAGTDLHAEVEEYIKHMLADFDGVAQKVNPGFSAGAQKFIDWAVANGIKFLASEKQVYSKEWFCAGTFDFSFEKQGQRFIGDLKTMKKMWDRVPFFQTAAYMKMSQEMGEAPYHGSCIVNVNKESFELTEHWTFDHESDRLAFEAALTLYRQLANF